METIEPQQLPLRLEIDPEESALGFTLRALRANGIDFKAGMQWLGLLRQRRTGEHHARRLGWLLNTDPDTFSQRLVLADSKYLWIQLAGHSLKRYAVSPSLYAKLCPLCTREKAITRLSWLLRPMVGCPRHGYSLLLSCQYCGRKIGWDRPDVDVCRCGYPFKATSGVVPLEPDVQAWVDWLECTLLPPLHSQTNDGSVDLPAALTHMSIDGAFRVVEALGLRSEPGTCIHSARAATATPREQGRVIARGLMRLREIESDPDAARRLSGFVHHGALIDLAKDFAAPEDQALAWWLLNCMRIVEPGPTRAGIRPKGQLPLFLR